MKLRAGLLFVALAGVWQNAAPQSPPSQPNRYALVGAMLLDGYDTPPIHHSVVLIEGNRIQAVGPQHEVEVPEGTPVIDLQGKTVAPGLIDTHIHLDLIGHGDYDRYYRFIGGTKRLPEVMPIAAKQLLRAGVTSALDLGSPFDILAVRDRINSGSVPGPRLTISGPWITRVYLPGVPDAYQVLIKSPKEAAQQTAALIEQGSDVIKTWVGLTQEDYQAVVKTAHENNVKVHAHLYNPGAIQAAINAKVDVFQHVGSARNPFYDDKLIAQITHNNIPIVQTISHRIWVYPATVAFPERLQNPILQKDTPTDIYRELMDSFRDFHRLSYFNDVEQEKRNAEKSASQFIEANAYMGVGTDSASPLNFHYEAIWFELAALVDSGMTPRQAISAATKTNAEILGQIQDLGTVEPGKLADLIVVDGNLLKRLPSRPRPLLVIKDGVIWLNEDAAGSVTTPLSRPF